MNIQTETQDKPVLTGESPHRIPRRVWLAAGIALAGAILTAVVAIVNENPGGGAGQMWSVAAPCISPAAMIAVVCYAIVRYR